MLSAVATLRNSGLTCDECRRVIQAWLADADELFSEVVAVEEPDEGCGCVFEALGDGFFPNHFVGFDQLRHFSDKLVLCIEVITNDEPLHANAFADDLK